MTTIDTRPESATAEVGASAFFAGAAAWLTSTDHKRIGRLYLGLGLLALLATALVGAVLGLERADDTSLLLDADSLLQTFQAYRVGLVFGGLLPMAVGLSIAVAPMQLGARSIAFPRVALTGLYAWLGGFVLTMVSLGRNGGIGGGDSHAVDMFLSGHGLMILGLLASAGCVATSVLSTRAPGMTMRRVPLFAWSALIGALGMLLVLPVAFGTIIYLFVDHRLGTQQSFGGSEGIAAWIGWVLSVPAIIVYALPAIGVAAEMIPVTFKHRQAMRGVKFAGIALIGVTALAATTHQYAFPVELDTNQSGSDFIESLVPFLIFTGLPLLGLVIVMGLGALTAKQGLAHGKPKITAGFVFSFFGLGMVAVGIVGNFLQSIVDLELLGTSFEEGATLYVVYGSVLSLMGGLLFWAPKLWGRVVPDKQALPLALLGVGGTILAALPLYIAGFLGQVGGVPSNDMDVARILNLDFSGSAQLLLILSLIGHALVGLTILAFAGLLLKTFTGRGEAADENPNGGHTVEWGTSSPAPAHNFDAVPTVASAEPRFDMTYEGSLS